MKAEFNVVTAGAIERALDMMGCLYSEGGATHDRERARRAVEGLMASPELGAVWLIEVKGDTAGYLCVTLCYSLEFAGHYALLDELYLNAEWRGRGVGAQAI